MGACSQHNDHTRTQTGQRRKRAVFPQSATGSPLHKMNDGMHARRNCNTCDTCCETRAAVLRFSTTGDDKCSHADASEHVPSSLMMSSVSAAHNCHTANTRGVSTNPPLEHRPNARPIARVACAGLAARQLLRSLQSAFFEWEALSTSSITCITTRLTAERIL